MIQKTLPVQASRHILHQQIINLCHSIDLPLHWNYKGPKLFTNYQRVGLIVLFLRSKKSLRDFTKELCELKWVSWLGLKKLPKKSTLHDWLKIFNLGFIRSLFNTISKKENPSLMAIDATGVDSWQRSRHYQKRALFEHMPYAKLDLLVDTKSKIIHDFVLRVKPRHDVLGAKTMFKRMKQKKVKILGDKGYDAEELHQIAHKMSNIFYAPVRKSTRKLPKGRFRKKAKEGDEDYPQRNQVESIIHSLKQKRGSVLRSKKHYMKKREMGWKIIVHNLELLNRIIQIILWHLKMSFRTQPCGTKVYKRNRKTETYA